jgi:tRNA(Ile)-lysidine synthase
MLPRAAIDGLLVCRPLLEVRRADLQAFLRDGKHTWREDHTNASPQYLRNRVRHELMPVLLQIAPRAVEALGRLARLAAETQQLVHDAAAGIAPTTPRARRSVTLPRRALRHAPPAVAAEVLRQAIAGLGGSSESADFERVQAFLQVLRSGAGGKELQMGLGITARIEGEHVRVQCRRKS